MLLYSSLDTEHYDRPDNDENKASSLFDNFGINCLEGRRTDDPQSIQRKDGNSIDLEPPVATTSPKIPKWGTKDSYKRQEKQPVASFQISLRSNSTEIVFDPPMYFLLFTRSLTFSEPVIIFS